MSLNKTEQLERERDKSQIERLNRSLHQLQTKCHKQDRLLELLVDMLGLDDDQYDAIRQQVEKEFTDT